jgi:toxin ParE1/3/4
MITWKVVYTGQAEQDLRQIYEYITFSLLEPGVGRNLSRRIMAAVAGLNQMPLRHRLYEKEPWHSKGLRILPVDNYLVFYLPVETHQTVVVIRIMYGGRNIEAQLRLSDREHYAD